MAAITLAPNTFTSPSTGKEYFYLTAGPEKGPLLMFLHGWPGLAVTWRPQLLGLASLGFRVVAPDMPGYGGTWTSEDASEFELEKVVPQLLELLHHVGGKDAKAIWFGHDWGCGPLNAIAAHHPEACRAMVGISVPYRTLEMGLPAFLHIVDRELYPESEYPNGQWDYQIFYEQEPRAVDRQFETNVRGYVKLLFSRGSPAAARAPARTAQVVKDKGWFGGPGAPIPDLPLEKTVLDADMLDQLTESLTRKGFRGATSWYLNHEANRRWGLEKSVDGGVLKMPFLFIHTEYDAVCQTVYNPQLTQAMRDLCQNLSEFVIKSGHWGALECPEEVNAGVVSWIIKEVSDWWPGPEIKS